MLMTDNAVQISACNTFFITTFQNMSVVLQMLLSEEGAEKQDNHTWLSQCGEISTQYYKKPEIQYYHIFTICSVWAV